MIILISLEISCRRLRGVSRYFARNRGMRTRTHAVLSRAYKRVRPTTARSASVFTRELHMRAIIGTKLLSSSEAQPATKPFEIYDSRLPGFTLRVQPSGVRSYYARFGRNRRISLGKVGALLPEEAREKCQKVLGNIAHGHHPLQGRGGTDGLTLGQFLDEIYSPWGKAN